MPSPAKCREIVWERDQRTCRCCGDPVEPDGFRPQFIGQVHHLKGRRVAPEWKTDPDRQILVCLWSHRLITGVWGGKLIRLMDPDDPTMPAVDATKKILWVRKDKNGVELWRMIR